MKNLGPTLVLIGVIIMLLGVLAKSNEAEKREAITYCRLVHDHKWPDYAHVYHQQCKPDGSVNWDYVNGR